MNINEVNWHEIVSYSEESPSGLIWNKGQRWEGCFAGTRLTKKSGKYTWRIKKFGKMFLCHRIIWNLFYGKVDEKLEIDHIDGQSHNNHISNLRLVSGELNGRNKGLSKVNKTGFKGVSSKDGLYYVVQIRAKGVRVVKHFSIKKLGKEVAFEMAKNFYIEEINKLNDLGFGYTKRHMGEEI